MNHAVVTEHLADYLEGDLALDRRALVDAHLDTCEACAQEVREMQQTIRLLRALPEPEHPPLIAANVMRRIRAGETTPSFLERIQRTFGSVLEPSFVLPASAVAVAALVVVAVQGSGPLSRSFGRADEQVLSEAGETAGTNLSAREAASSVVAVDGHFGASAAREFATVPAPRSASVAPGSRLVNDGPPQAPRNDSDPASKYAAGEMMAVSAWEARRLRQGFSGSTGGTSFFRDPVLARGYASEVAGPDVARPSSRVPGEIGTAVPLSLSRRVEGDSRAYVTAESGGEDPRDVWLARALENPAEFARYIARHNLAEQEIWVERLSERALSRGLFDELIDALRGAGEASWLADDFAAQAKVADSDETSRGSETTSMDGR